MRKIHVILFLIFLNINNVFGQKLYYGYNLGMDIVDYKYLGPTPIAPFNARLSYNLGLNLSYKCTNILFLDLGLLFAEKGAKIKYPGSSKPVVFKDGYLSTSVKIKIKVLKRFLIAIGPEYGYLLYEKKREVDGKIYNMVNKVSKKNEFSGRFGLEYVFNKNVSIYANYIHSFTPIYKGIVSNDPDPSVPYKIYNRQYSIGIQYTFKLGK
jgi:Outer membrane protein beta-barrel domain